NRSSRSSPTTSPRSCDGGRPTAREGSTMASPATGDSLTVLDPSLFVYAFFNRHRPRFGQPDSRRAMLKLLGRFVGCHRLREHRKGFRVSRWWDLDLLEVHRQDDSFVRWIHRRRTQPGTLRQQAIVYSFGDTLFLH